MSGFETTLKIATPLMHVVLGGFVGVTLWIDPFSWQAVLSVGCALFAVTASTAGIVDRLTKAESSE